MSLFVMNRQLIESIETAKYLKFYYKRTKFEGLPMGLVAESESSYSEPEFRSIHELSTSTSLYHRLLIESCRNSLSNIAKNPRTKRPFLGVQLERLRFGRQKTELTLKSDETMLKLACAYLELKLAWLVQEMEQRTVETRLNTFVEMEGALVVEKQYYEFFTAFKHWMPRVTRFFYACIVFYDPSCTTPLLAQIVANTLLATNDSAANGSQLRFPLTVGLTAQAFRTKEMVSGTVAHKNYESELDNFANFPQVANFVFIPLFNQRGQALGVAQFYNCRLGEITDEVMVSLWTVSSEV